MKDTKSVNDIEKEKEFLKKFNELCKEYNVALCIADPIDGFYHIGDEDSIPMINMFTLDYGKDYG